MKTLAKILIAVSALLFAIESTASNREGNSVPVSTSEILYVVNINVGNVHTGAKALDLFVFITDEQGRLVAPVQAVRPGHSSYSFREAGPVLGTRIAKMIFSSMAPASLPFYCAPDSRTGKFVNGGTYYFNLFPTTNPPNAQ